MEQLLLYSLRSAGVLAVFYLFYKVLLSRETFHRFNRAVLLLSVVLASVLPLCRITRYREVVMERPKVTCFPLQLPVPAVREEPSDGRPWSEMAGRIYLCGVAGALFYWLVSMGAVARLIRGGRRRRFGRRGVRLVLHARKEAPFSWIRWIVLSEHDFRTAARPILTHECAHLRLGHSADLLAVDLLGVLQWFNPALWLVRTELRAIHEYEADAAVLRSGADAREYQLLLIKKAVGARWCSVANSFNHSKLKNRITMMLREKSSARTALRALYLVPLTGFALGAFARTVILPVCPEDKVNEISALVQESEAEKTAVEAVASPKFRMSVRYSKGSSASESGAGDGVAAIQAESDSLKVVDATSSRIGGSDGDSIVYIVDGKEVGTIENLAPERIASISVLKNSEALSKYGGRAKDGLIVITTESTESVDRAAPGAAESVDRTASDASVKVTAVTSARTGGSEGDSVVYIVDGKEVGTIENLAPERIASILVLKNLEVLSKYGKRVKDGLIIITTKLSESVDHAASGAAESVDRAASDASVKVLGVNSFRVADGDSVVYVVDGKEVDTIENLAPEQIASISVLKNSEALSKYGGRAKDGLIVITTKPAESVDRAAPDAAESVDRAASGAVESK